MKENEINIENRKEIEFEFEYFNIIYDPIEELWILNEYDENDDEEFILIEDKDLTYEDNEDFWKEKGLQKENFDKLKDFINEKNKKI